MIRIETRFDCGYVAPVGRGVKLWNGDRENRIGSEVFLHELIYDALGEDIFWSRAYDLHGITIKIEIEKAELSEPYRRSESQESVQMSAKFTVIAHRGASSYAPENTFAAFDKALEMGVVHVELDVHFSRDGHIVIIHDDSVDRTTDGKGRVADLTLAELKALDAGSWFAPEYAGQRIPTLGELLQNYKGRLHFHIEIKGRQEGLSQRTADMVRGYGVTDSVTITSFQKVRLEEVRAYAPELPAGWLVPSGPATWDSSIVDQARALGLTQVCPRADLVTPDLVDHLHSQGFIVRAWGIADEGLMRRVVDAGADGMTINFPDKLLEYLKAKGVRA